MKFFVKLTLLTWFISQAACAAENEGGAKESETSVATISAASLDAIKIKAQAVFKGVNPQYKVASINESGIDGFYLVQIEQGPAVYVNADVSHFFTGEAFRRIFPQLIASSGLAPESELNKKKYKQIQF